jgi:hypothetical protein
MMLGEQIGLQDRLFYEFDLDERVPADHFLRKIDAVLDLSWLRSELSPFYSHTGRPSIDPELMIRRCCQTKLLKKWGDGIITDVKILTFLFGDESMPC